MARLNDGDALSVGGVSLAVMAAADGVTDDSATIQGVINAAYTMGVKLVVFPPGVYVVKNVRLKSGITYDLTGATILTHPGSPLGGNTFNANGERDIVLKGGVIDGNKGVTAGSAASGTTLLQLIGSSNIRITGVKFRNNEYLAVIPSQATNIRVEYCEFIDVDCAFQPAQDCHDIWAIGNYIVGGSSDGIVIWSTGSSVQSTNVHIISNTIKNKTGGYGIIVRRCVGFEVAGNVIENCAHGINLGAAEAGGIFAEQGVITGNTIRRITNGYALGGSVARHVTVANNHIHDCDQCGIWLTSCNDLIVTGNFVVNVNSLPGTDSDGIRLTSCSRVTVTGCQVFDTRGEPKHYTGIRIVSGAANRLTYNAVRGSTLAAIYIASGVQTTYVNDNDAPVSDNGTGTNLVA